MANLGRKRNSFRGSSFRDEVYLEELVDIGDGRGGNRSTWQPRGTRQLARIEERQGTEVLIDGALFERGAVRVVIRKPDFEVDGRFRFVETRTGRELYIFNVKNIQNRDRYLECECTDSKPNI